MKTQKRKKEKFQSQKLPKMFEILLNDTMIQVGLTFLLNSLPRLYFQNLTDLAKNHIQWVTIVLDYLSRRSLIITFYQPQSTVNILPSSNFLPLYINIFRGLSLSIARVSLTVLTVINSLSLSLSLSLFFSFFFLKVPIFSLPRFALL